MAPTVYTSPSTSILVTDPAGLGLWLRVSLQDPARRQVSFGILLVQGHVSGGYPIRDLCGTGGL